MQPLTSRQRLLISCLDRLIPNTRSHPLHLHLTRSLLHLTRHTDTYVPLAPYLLPVLTTTLSPTSKPKASTLRPLDFEVNIRAPQQYLKTRVYNEGLAEESSYLLAEYLSSAPVHGNIAFTELVVPITTALRKALKAAKGSSWKAKETGLIKGLVERIEESANWLEQKRKGVNFAPNSLDEVERWERDLKLEEAPLSKYVKVQKKARDKKRKMLERVRHSSYTFLDHLLNSHYSYRRGTAKVRCWKTEGAAILSTLVGTTVGTRRRSLYGSSVNGSAAIHAPFARRQ